MLYQYCSEGAREMIGSGVGCSEVCDAEVDWQVHGPAQACLRVSLPAIPEGLCWILPSVSVCGVEPCGYRCRLVLPGHREPGASRSLVPVGNWPAETGAPVDDVDCFILQGPLSSAELLIDMVAPDLERLRRQPLLVTVSVTAGARTGPEACPQTASIPVPPRSQMVLAPELRRRVCSPVCLAMVLEHYGRVVPLPDVLAAAYNARAGIYGLWPANIWAASRFGVLGCVHRFTSMGEAAGLLARGVPLITTLRYGPGELRGAAVDHTPGHLVVLCGCGRGVVQVNDPAAPQDAAVARQYDFEEFRTAWIGTRGVAYVLVPPGGTEARS